MRKLAVYTLLLAVLLLIAGPIQAGDPEILDLKPPMGTPGLSPGEPDLHEGKFDGYGVIDRIDEQAVVIDDAVYRLSGAVAFKYLDGRTTTVENFPVGTRVWFVLYTDNIIKSVWKEGG